MTRHYFRKAVAPPTRVRRKRDAHKGVIVAVKKREGLRMLSRLVSSAWAAQQIGRSKGGLTSAVRGVAHRWTSEEARAAALRSWRKRYKRSRAGRPSKNRAAIDRAALRVWYAKNPTLGISYIPQTIFEAGFWHCYDDSMNRRVSERAALIRLGHLPSYHKHRTFTPEDSRVVQRRKK